MYSEDEQKLGEILFQNSLQPVDENVRSNPEPYNELNFTLLKMLYRYWKIISDL